MKSRFFNCASLASALIHTSSNLSVVADASFSNNLRGNGNEQHVNRPRVLQKEEEVIFLESEFMPFMDEVLLMITVILMMMALKWRMILMTMTMRTTN